MPYPPLVLYSEENEYRIHYEQIYCKAPLICFDGISVRFRKEQFKHVFYESVNGGTDNLFSIKRAKRINWIKAALEDPASELFVGWNRRTKCYDHNRRVTVVMGNYVVVIELLKNGFANFITAYVADSVSRRGKPSTIDLIRSAPKWR